MVISTVRIKKILIIIAIALGIHAYASHFAQSTFNLASSGFAADTASQASDTLTGKQGTL